VVVVASIVILGVVVNGAAGYVFAFGRLRWLKVVFWAMMMPIFVTRFVLIISQFVVMGKLGLRGLPAVVLMAVFWPTGIYLFRNYFGGVPASLLETARMEGASEWRILADVVLPISKPIVGAAIVFLAMAGMGDFLWQMVNLQRREQYTVLVALVNSTIDVRMVDRVGYDLAVGTTLFLPYVALFAFTSRYFVQGIAVGGVKD
jgi:ABC-type glycerol-3-phosphate transport system permease component